MEIENMSKKRDDLMYPRMPSTSLILISQTTSLLLPVFQQATSSSPHLSRDMLSRPPIGGVHICTHACLPHPHPSSHYHKPYFSVSQLIPITWLFLSFGFPQLIYLPALFPCTALPSRYHLICLYFRYLTVRFWDGTFWVILWSLLCHIVILLASMCLHTYNTLILFLHNFIFPSVNWLLTLFYFIIIGFSTESCSRFKK